MRAKTSSPNPSLMRGLRTRATGSRAKVLSPRSPSARRSTLRPVPNAMKRAATVEYLMGRHRTITGRMLRVT